MIETTPTIDADYKLVKLPSPVSIAYLNSKKQEIEATVVSVNLKQWAQLDNKDSIGFSQIVSWNGWKIGESVNIKEWVEGDERARTIQAFEVDEIHQLHEVIALIKTELGTVRRFFGQFNRTEPVEIVPVESITSIEDAEVEKLNRELEETEATADAAVKATLMLYLKLGEALTIARKDPKKGGYGKWGQWLKDRGIDENRSKRAIRLSNPENRAKLEAIAESKSVSVTDFTLTEALNAIRQRIDNQQSSRIYQNDDREGDSHQNEFVEDELGSASLLSDSTDTQIDSSEVDATEIAIPKPRIENDFYPTAQALTEALLKVVDINGQVLEPCAGDGAIAEMFTGYIANEPFPPAEFHPDYELDATDPASWEQFDADGGCDWVVTNPPFNKASAILPLAFKHARVGVAFLLRLSYLEPCDDRADWLQQYSDSLVQLMPFSPRPRFRADTNGSDSVTCAWFVWRKDFSWSQTNIPCPFTFIKGWR